MFPSRKTLLKPLSHSSWCCPNQHVSVFSMLTSRRWHFENPQVFLLRAAQEASKKQLTDDSVGGRVRAQTGEPGSHSSQPPPHPGAASGRAGDPDQLPRESPTLTTAPPSGARPCLQGRTQAHALLGTDPFWVSVSHTAEKSATGARDGREGTSP